MRGAALAICLAATILGRSARADSVADAWAGTAWGESLQALQRAIGSRAFALPQPIDFGDSYAPLVVRQLPVGGFPLIVYYQIDKASHGLKRIQLELPRHRVNAAAFRGVYDALAGALGIPDTACGAAPGAATGYQGTAEYAWRRDGLVIRAIFRDTSLEALGGCVSPACGLTAQLLVRVSPPALDGGTCAKLPTRGELRAPP